MNNKMIIKADVTYSSESIVNLGNKIEIMILFLEINHTISYFMCS